MATREQKTEAATPTRRQEARREGMLLQAPEVSRALGVVGMAVLGLWLAGAAAAMLQTLMGRLATAEPPTFFNVDFAGAEIHSVLAQTFGWMLPALLIALGIAMIGPILQHGVALQPFRFSFERLDPVKGFQRMFSTKALYDTPIALFKLLLVGTVAGALWWTVIRPAFGMLWPLGPLADKIGRGAETLGFAVAGASLVIAALDFLVARGQHERDLRMSRQEVKEEQRRTEGDPLVRARTRSLQRRLARMRMISKVAEADVVVTNPTHYAVALQYRPGRMQAPEVVAKGRGLIAERIKEEARLHGVPLVENVPLAQALHRSVEIGHPIPPALFQAVAEVLAFVYRQRGGTPGAGS